MIVCLLLALTACTGQGSTPNRAASPSALPTAAPSGMLDRTSATSSPNPTPTPLVLAVADSGPGLALYSLAPAAHSAVLLRRLAIPPDTTPAAISLSGGTRPTVCVVFEAIMDHPNELWCYPAGASQGRLVTRNVSYAVAVRDDGRALAWTDRAQNQGLVLADLAGAVATVRSRQSYDRDAPADRGVPESLDALSWLGPATLAGTSGGDSDEGRGLCVIDVNHPRGHEGQGFGRCLHPTGKESDLGYAHFELAALVRPGVVATKERIMDCCTDAPTVPAARAVEVRIVDGTVIGVVATPRAGRDVIDISGGPRALVYTTGVNGRSEISVSVRWAGEAHGVPITGLPRFVHRVVAQP
jgi:hypothetical protein